MPAKPLIAMGLYFFPRGGSAQVGRYLAESLGRRGVDVRLVAGSLGPRGEQSNAQTFYGDVLTDLVDYTEAAQAFGRGEDPMATAIPMHASYEDRADVPDRVFTKVSRNLASRQVEAWTACFHRLGIRPDVVHLHHLTPLHDAAQRVWPGVPIVSHVHGTEIKMLQAIASGQLCETPDSGWWSDTLKRYARASSRLMTSSTHDAALARDILETPESVLRTCPYGVDTERFSPRSPAQDARLTMWRRWIVEQPRGWREGGEPGSITYTAGQFEEAFVDPRGNLRPVLLYVGRFTSFKRTDVLLEAYRRLEDSLPDCPPLVIWGGYPGEWEGEHPHTLSERLNLKRVFFAGWRGHDDLPLALAAANLFVAPSVHEPFGQVYFEAMSCGVPVIGTSTGGPATFVVTEGDEATGWLADPADVTSLHAKLQAALTDPAELRRRGENGRRFVTQNYAWNAIAGRFEDLYDELRGERQATGALAS